MSELIFNNMNCEISRSSARLSAVDYKALTRKALFPWLFDSLLDWTIIGVALGIFSLLPNIGTFILSVLVLGNRQHALTVLAHDGAHFCLSSNKKINDFLANVLCFLPLGLTVSGYRALHNSHHKYTGTDNDPELAHKRMRAPQWDLPANKWNILRYAFMDLIGGSIKDYVIIVKFSKPIKNREYAYLIGFHLCAAGSLLFLHLWWVLAIWYFSLITSFMMFFRLRLWLEHQNTPDTLRVELNWWQGALLSPHNAFYHDEHHQYPTIPYHRLPRARAFLKGENPKSLSALIRDLESARKIASGASLKSSATIP